MSSTISISFMCHYLNGNDFFFSFQFSLFIYYTSADFSYSAAE
ncbi:hypothetical protein YPPY64_3492 [Yersinia pestis PY-64]|nr:hypothetical protein YPPY06_3418 [Yersinia pestis PY-06]EIR17685.1 hypothetical protein YPPY09_3425 [Yersinia pestis PY-09]EIS15576.1 hypothetical protein YPPY52_3446 [Yersinia pestis PY-52]EIS57863.1 hypothetical protein YPPY64_3492 [Yersinia pestis PY-64]EIT57581.1 hypothetical protein YPPY113_3503 [Yersinia pestis PY-113]